jgi:hypothetical protein
MNINLNNYEEYFLLYADNELSQQQRNEVEVFIKENQELEREFEMIKSTINVPDEEVSLSDKSFLFKKDSTFIHENNYKEIFVLYYDNELSKEERVETEKFVNFHSEFKEEFELFSQTKLFSETDIVFTDKRLLYRKEKVVKIVPLKVWRALAAAVFIGFGLWIFIAQENQLTDLPFVAVKENTTQRPATTAPSSISGPTKSLTPSEKKNTASINLVSTEKDKNSAKKLLQEDKEEKNIDRNEVLRTVNVKIPGQKSIENTVVKNNGIEKSEQFINTVPDLNYKIETNNSSLLAAKNETVSASNNLSESKTQLTYPDVNNANNNYIFYNVPAEDFKKSKVGIFLKKVRRIVERNDPIKRLLSGDEKQIVLK